MTHYTFVTFGNGQSVNIFKKGDMGELVDVAFLQDDDAAIFLEQIEDAENVDTSAWANGITNDGLVQSVMADYDI